MFVIFASNKNNFKKVNIDKLIKFSCEYFGIKESKLYSHNTSDDCSICRYIIWYYLHYECNLTTRKISDAFFRKKITVFKGISKFKNCLILQKYYRDMYNTFVEKYHNSIK